MISEQAKLKLENDAASAFTKLNSQLNVIKINEEVREKASAPPVSGTKPAEEVVRETLMEPTAPLMHHHFEASQTTVVDFNLEKIRQLNQLNYPRLAWNKQSSRNQHATTHNEELEATQNDFQVGKINDTRKKINSA